MTSQLKSVLSKSQLLKGSSNVKITSKVNPAILGGMLNSGMKSGIAWFVGLVVEVGEKTIDLSISSRLAKLNKLVTELV